MFTFRSVTEDGGLAVAFFYTYFFLFLFFYHPYKIDTYLKHFFKFHLCFTCFHLPIVIFFPFIHLPLAPRLGPPLHFNRPCSTQPTRVSWSCLHLPSRALFQERWISRRFFSSPVKDCTLGATCVGDLSVIRCFSFVFHLCTVQFLAYTPRAF